MITFYAAIDCCRVKIEDGKKRVYIQEPEKCPYLHSRVCYLEQPALGSYDLRRIAEGIR